MGALSQVDIYIFKISSSRRLKKWVESSYIALTNFGRSANSKFPVCKIGGLQIRDSPNLIKLKKGLFSAVLIFGKNLSKYSNI